VGHHLWTHHARALAHMLLAAFLTSGMSILATGAWYMLRGTDRPEARIMLRWGRGLVDRKNTDGLLQNFGRQPDEGQR
jgi:hypothetical protein